MTIIKQHPLLKKVLQILNMWLKLCQKVIKNDGIKMLNIVDKILEFALYQMLSRLPISLAQSKAGNNSEKL